MLVVGVVSVVTILTPPVPLPSLPLGTTSKVRLYNRRNCCNLNTLHPC